MKMKRIGITVALSLGIIGCATAPVPDTTPKHPTLVEQSEFVLDAQILPTSRGTETTFTRADRQRHDETYTFDNWFMKKLLGEGKTSQITRIDKNLIWQLDPENKQYNECQLTGCALSGLDFLKQNKGQSQPKEAPEPKEQDSCPLTIVKNKFSVKATGENRVINGFDTTKYLVSWNYEAKDKLNRKNKSTITFDIWNTQSNKKLLELMQVKKEYNEALLAKLGNGKATLKTLVPGSVFKVLEPVLKPYLKQFKKIKGYPISTKLEWYASNKACVDAEEAKPAQNDSPDVSNWIGGFVSGLASSLMQKKVEEKMTPDASKPILRYIQDVKSIQIKPVHDSVFQVPADYKLVNRQ
jgi:hypothetical protein